MFYVTDREAFEARFIDGLVAMLDAEELGAFILVLANSMQDNSLGRRPSVREDGSQRGTAVA